MVLEKIIAKAESAHQPPPTPPQALTSNPDQGGSPTYHVYQLEIPSAFQALGVLYLEEPKENPQEKTKDICDLLTSNLRRSLLCILLHHQEINAEQAYQEFLSASPAERYAQLLHYPVPKEWPNNSAYGLLHVGKASQGLTNRSEQNEYLVLVPSVSSLKNHLIPSKLRLFVNGNERFLDRRPRPKNQTKGAA